MSIITTARLREIAALPTRGHQAQALYDHVCAHLVEQDCQSVEVFASPTNPSAATRCLYRRPPIPQHRPTVSGPRPTSTLACAVGALIPDELYIDRMEGGDVSGLLLTRSSTIEDQLCDYNQEFGPLLHAHEPMLRDLQGAHDDRSSWCPGRAGLTRAGHARLVSIARDHGLRPLPPLASPPNGPGPAPVLP